MKQIASSPQGRRGLCPAYHHSCLVPKDGEVISGLQWWLVTSQIQWSMLDASMKVVHGAARKLVVVSSSPGGWANFFMERAWVSKFLHGKGKDE